MLIFLIQFADHVELLEINDHKHFATRPVGHLIAALQSSWLRNMEREIAEAEAQAKQAAEAADRAAAELRAIEIRAALLRSGLLPKPSDETT